MNRHLLHIISFLILVFSITGCKMPAKNQLPPLKETYAKDDKNPFGGNVTFNKLLSYFNNVKAVYGDVFTIDKDSSEEKGMPRSLYIMISDKLFFSEDEAEWLTSYVKRGNDLFISANEIDPRFLQLFGCQTNQRMAHLNDRVGNMEETKTSIFFGKNIPLVSFKYYYYPFNDYFKKFKDDNIRVLGVNDKVLPNFAIIFYGKGRLYVNLAPRAFSNYFLLTGKNIRYLGHIFGYLRSNRKPVYWDEYYKTLSTTYIRPPVKKEFNTLSVISGNPSLKWAFFIAVFGFAFFLFSGVRRKQRIIPVSKEESNASVDFVEALGRLYFVNKNNKNIADKRITFFKEYIRNKFFLSKVETDSTFATKLAAKSGWPLDRSTELLNCIEMIDQTATVSDEQLLSLNNQLENFYNRK